MYCPRCEDDLREQERSGILVDVCPKCKGVWLDRGELDKLIEGEQRYYGEDDDDDDDEGEFELEGPRRGRRGKRGRKKEGFFQNIMDIFGD